MQVTRVDERLLGRQFAQPHRRIPAGLDERGNTPVDLGAPGFPPEDLRAVIETWRSARLTDDLFAGRASHPGYLRGAARVEPRIVRGDVAAVCAYAEDARHLPVDPDRGQPGRVDPRRRDAGPDAAAYRPELILGILFDGAGGRPMQPRLAERTPAQPAVAVHKHGLGALRADVDSEEMIGIHAPSARRRILPAAPASAVR